MTDFANSNETLELFVEPIAFNKYSVYFDEEIKSASYYRVLCETLRSSSENDHFTFYINSDGGDLYGAIAISSAIEDTMAHVHGVLIGTGASAASMIFLSCHSFEINHRSRLMIHEPTYYQGGRHSDNKAALLSDDQWFTEMYKVWYGDFITDEEMDLLVNTGTPVYYHYDELVLRLDALSKRREEAISGYMKDNNQQEE